MVGDNIDRTASHFIGDPPYHQSDRTGEWKRYQVQVSRLALEPNQEPRVDTITQWLTIDENREPISPTARTILSQLHGGGHLD
jgi:hypothetical protein